MSIKDKCVWLIYRKLMVVSLMTALKFSLFFYPFPVTVLIPLQRRKIWALKISFSKNLYFVTTRELIDIPMQPESLEIFRIFAWVPYYSYHACCTGKSWNLTVENPTMSFVNIFKNLRLVGL